MIKGQLLGIPNWLRKKIDKNEEAINKLDNKLKADDLQFQFATDGEGNYGYLGADDSFIPFKGNGAMTIKAQSHKSLAYNTSTTGSVSLSYTTKKDCSAILICASSQPSGYPFSSHSSNCKINGVEQNTAIAGQAFTIGSSRVVFIEKLSAGSVIDLVMNGVCHASSYGAIGVVVITNE